jgi:hypothetical protein
VDDTDIAEDWDIEIGGECDRSCFWEELEPAGEREFSIQIRMKVRAMRLLT